MNPKGDPGGLCRNLSFLHPAWSCVCLELELVISCLGSFHCSVPQCGPVVLDEVHEEAEEGMGRRQCPREVKSAVQTTGQGLGTGTL